jgi:hypothetical protein
MNERDISTPEDLEVALSAKALRKRSAARRLSRRGR